MPRGGRSTDAALFWSRVDKDAGGGCWIWGGSKKRDGYGYHGSYLAHRLALLLVGRTIPRRAEVDHLCRVRACVRPSHLEVVSREENQRRAILASRSHPTCRNGHVRSDATAYMDRRGFLRCRVCERNEGLRYRSTAKYRAAYAARRAAGARS